jgi:hypothetical protein
LQIAKQSNSESIADQGYQEVLPRQSAQRIDPVIQLPNRAAAEIECSTLLSIEKRRQLE